MDVLWDFVKTLSTLLSMIFLVIIVYAWIHFSELRTKEKKEMKERFARHGTSPSNASLNPLTLEWSRIEEYMRSESPSDWKIAILEADNMLEEVVTQKGYSGDTFGEKLKQVTPGVFPYLDLAWEAHKFRNDIAHSTHRPLARHEAERIIGLFYRVFKEQKVI